MDRELVWFREGQEALGGSEHLTHTLGTFVRLAAEAALADAGSFYAMRNDQIALVPYVTFGLPAEYTAGCGAVLVGDQCCGRAALHKHPWIVSDMLNDPLFAAARVAAVDSPVRAGFSVPVLTLNGDCIGTLACHFFRTHTPSTDDIFRNKLWADMIAFTINEQQNKALGSTLSVAVPTVTTADPV